MARRRRHQNVSDRSSAVTSTTANHRLPRPISFSAPHFDPLHWTFEDRREYHPEYSDRPAATYTSEPAYVTPTPAKGRPGRKFSRLPFGLTFAQPAKVLICVRRKARKEVLFALKKTGKGRGGGRKRKSWHSKIGC